MITPDTPLNAVRPAEWRANYLLRPNMRLLTASIQDYGWLAPILVRRSDSKIIDGFHRWVVAQNDKTIVKRDGGMVPVQWIDVDIADAMIMHIRMNRARGDFVARSISDLVRLILRTRKYDARQLADMLEMVDEEFNLLVDGSLLKIRKVSEHQYSAAWVPIEAPRPSENVASGIVLEKPPNPDR